jgi:hypothetical protein
LKVALKLAPLVIAPSPLAGEGNSMAPRAMMGEGLWWRKPLTHSKSWTNHWALSRKGRERLWSDKNSSKNFKLLQKRRDAARGVDNTKSRSAAVSWRTLVRYRFGMEAHIEQLAALPEPALVEQFETQ